MTSSWRPSTNATIARDAGSPTSAVIIRFVPGPGHPGVGVEPGHRSPSVVQAPRSGQGHHAVEIVEGVPRLVLQPAGPRAGQVRPPVTGRGVVQQEPPQQRAGVHHLQGHTG